MTNLEIQKHHKNELIFNGVYSRDNLSERSSTEHSSTETKDGAYIINLDEYSDIGTHLSALYVQNNNNMIIVIIVIIIIIITIIIIKT